MNVHGFGVMFLSSIIDNDPLSLIWNCVCLSVEILVLYCSITLLAYLTVCSFGSLFNLEKRSSILRSIVAKSWWVDGIRSVSSFLSKKAIAIRFIIFRFLRYRVYSLSNVSICEDILVMNIFCDRVLFPNAKRSSFIDVMIFPGNILLISFSNSASLIS